MVKHFLRPVLVICCICSGLVLNTGSIGDGIGIDINVYNGVWQEVTRIDCLGHATDYSKRQQFIEITKDYYRTHNCDDTKCEFCIRNDKKLEDYALDITLDDDTLTISFDDEGCESTMIMKKINSSVIKNTKNVCITYEWTLPI